MAESKFTPGPWGVLHDPSVPRSKRIGAVGKHLAIVSSSWMDLAEIQANAELMADAPELLNALRALCECTVADPEEDRDLARRVFCGCRKATRKTRRLDYPGRMEFARIQLALQFTHRTDRRNKTNNPPAVVSRCFCILGGQNDGGRDFQTNFVTFVFSTKETRL